MSLDRLKFLYKTLVLENAQHPQHHVDRLPADYSQVTLHNPTCGDTIHLAAKLENGRIVDIVFNGSGCTISQASASLMTQAVCGKAVEEVPAMVNTFSKMAMGEKVDESAIEKLGDAAVMANVAQFPARIKCATMSWHAVQALIQQQ